MADRAERPDVLIENWIPMRELGIESRRETSTGLHPAPNRLHVWWARRPLTVSRAAILASLLPPDTDHEWFLKTLGIFGDPVAARAEIEYSKRTGVKVAGYTYGRAYKYTPPSEVVEDVRRRIAEHWGDGNPTVLDPMAGGGSIPFEALRYGFNTYANELNPVAAVILEATLRYPLEFGADLLKDLGKWANAVHERARPRLLEFYPKQPGERILAYVWARTVRCPSCGLLVPLSPNWWLERTGDTGTAVRLLPPRQGAGDECEFEIVGISEDSDYDPSEGTVSRGTGRCPRPDCGRSLPSDHIKTEAQEGRMGEQMYAVTIKTAHGKDFRLPTNDDCRAYATAVALMQKEKAEWRARDLIPDERYPQIASDPRPNLYGMECWYKMFNPRQLLAHVTYLSVLQEVKAEILRVEEPLRANAITTYLALTFDKCCDWNSRQCTWHPYRQVVGHTFQRHDFSLKWSHTEFDHADMLWPWATKQITDAYEELAKLTSGGAKLLFGDVERIVHVCQGDAAVYESNEPESVDVIVVDPPYYDNVMYAECSDFFYVWQKRTLGDIYPEYFQTELTDKEREAVANPARFRDMESSARKLAEQDYEAKMRAVFARCHTLLKPDGVMTVMFTHKRVEAWDTLAAALIDAGFEVTAAWPVHTESEHSLHQAKKNACSSTILLVCRKRDPDKNGEGYWWDEIEPIVRQVTDEKVREFEDMGMSGVDLMVSTFGPALQVISSHWPVRNRAGREIRPDVALDEARRVVTNYRVRSLLRRDHGEVPFDPATEWTILAWDIYKAARFPYDEARKLAIAVGVDLDGTIKRRDIAYKQASDVVLREPKRRVKRGNLDPEASDFAVVIDGIHAAIHIWDEDGVAACRRFLDRTNLTRGEEFAAAVEALLHAIPQQRAEWNSLREIALSFLTERIDIPEPEQYELDLAESEDDEDDDE